MQCAVKGAMQGKSSREMAGECKELRSALDKWGYVEPEAIKRVFSEVEENKEEHLRRLFELGYEGYNLI